MASGVDIDLKDVFEKERFPKSNWQFISLVLYSPVGLILAILRFFIGFNACVAGSVLTGSPIVRSFVLRILSFVIGINVEQQNKQEWDKSTRVLVSNCVTRFDHIAFHLTTGCVTHKKSASAFPASITPGINDFTTGGSNLVDRMKSHVETSDVPLLIQPEETTSGKKCLLKFNTQVAEVANRVQPVVITVERTSWANTAATVLGSSTSSDLFWFLFSPYTNFKIRYLNVLHRDPDETDEDFTERMRTAIASALECSLSPFTASDKAEYEKRYLDELNRPAVSPYSRHPSPELLRMTNQVAEVLPYVPRDVILRDLGRTRSVDQTISNILEGAVSYTPVTMGSTQPRPAQTTARCPDLTSFPNSSQDRMLSLQEKKVKMIEEARRKYIEKHGLIL